MPFMLTFKRGTDLPSPEMFVTEPEAVIRACALIAQGGYANFMVIDGTGTVVTTDQQIRNRCKSTGMP
jgi:hypothetical protein